MHIRCFEILCANPLEVELRNVNLRNETDLECEEASRLIEIEISTGGQKASSPSNWGVNCRESLQFTFLEPPGFLRIPLLRLMCWKLPRRAACLRSFAPPRGRCLVRGGRAPLKLIKDKTIDKGHE